MGETQYDNPVFFEKYSQMTRSRQGLDGAGEWPTLEPLLPDFAGKRVLDMGCGYGWHCMYAAEHGAEQVIGFDPSEKMIAVARGKNKSQRIIYQIGSMETMDYPNESFDVVFSSLALHYVEDYEAVVEKVRRFLKPDGEFLFSCEHPVFTAQGPQEWDYDEAGQIRCFPVDRYFYEGRREAVFLGETVKKYHRTLTTYLTTLLNCHFRIEAVAEPQPPQEWMNLPGMADEMRRPMMLIVKARKEA